MNIQLKKPSKFILTGLSLFFISGFQTAVADQQNFIINCNADCAPIIEKVASMGGVVTNKYQNVNAISITIDGDYRAQLMAANPTAELTKDNIVSLPAPKDSVTVATAGEAQLLQGAELDKFIAEDMPAGFDFNNLLTGALQMNIAGFSGEGVVVAVIDTGTANTQALAGSVIGGENFVPGAGEPSATSTLNDNHGSQTGSMIAGHTFFVFTPGTLFAQSVADHLPESIFEIPSLGSVIPMFGSAPDASLYALKVFAAGGGGAPESRIIAAMDRAITQRTNYNNGMPVVATNPGCGAAENPCVFDSLNISVINMSLGGGTLFAGNDVEDLLTNKMLEVGITLIASAGNEGFAAITGGSPGTGRGALTVGAASTVGNERVLRDLQFFGQFGFRIGSFYRPASHHQMATFSSRGPSADGRISTDVVANGFATFVEGANGDLNVVSGTSFSAPMVAGAAATLVGAFPDAPAIAIRNSLVQGANPDILGDNSTAIDQGAGFIDIPASFNLLATNAVDTNLPRGKENNKVKDNIKHLGLKVIKADKNKAQKFHVSNLKSGQVAHFFIETKDKTDKLTININNIVASLPAAEQNLLFGDDIFFNLQDVITHTDAVIASGFITADREIVIDNPQTGILRLAVMGDWTNAGDISADIVIRGHKGKKAKKSAKGRVDQSETQIDSFFIPDGTTQVTFELSWKNNWGAYPTDDIDLFLADPSGAFNFAGATFDSPERVVINNPLAGTWTTFVDGFTVHGVNHGDGSEWELRITDQDGKSIKQDDDDDDDD